MIETNGMITVAEASRRLHLSIEQVRRKLREGTLKGQRVGNQWFVDETAVANKKRKGEPLISSDVMREVHEVAQRIAERNPGYVFDPVEMVRKVREEH
jgi:excisionase family DNA binding protein